MNQDEEGSKKLLLFKVAMIAIIAIIFFLWLANLKGVFESQKINTDKTWQKISSDMEKSLNRLDSISTNLSASSTQDKAFVEDLLNKASSTATSTASATSTSTEIKKELIDLIKTATTSPKRTNCPEYINCMPSIGQARPCVIPPGCEKITQIVY